MLRFGGTNGRSAEFPTVYCAECHRSFNARTGSRQKLALLHTTFHLRPRTSSIRGHKETAHREVDLIARKHGLGGQQRNCNSVIVRRCIGGRVKSENSKLRPYTVRARPRQPLAESEEASTVRRDGETADREVDHIARKLEGGSKPGLKNECPRAESTMSTFNFSYLCLYTRRFGLRAALAVRYACSKRRKQSANGADKE